MWAPSSVTTAAWLGKTPTDSYDGSYRKPPVIAVNESNPLFLCSTIIQGGAQGAPCKDEEADRRGSNPQPPLVSQSELIRSRSFTGVQKSANSGGSLESYVRCRSPTFTRVVVETVADLWHFLCLSSTREEASRDRGHADHATLVLFASAVPTIVEPMDASMAPPSGLLSNARS